MRGRRHLLMAVAAGLMAAGCADMAGIGPLDVAAPPETVTSPTTPPPARDDDESTPAPAPTRHGESALDPSPACTEGETPFVAPRVVFNRGGGSAWAMTSAIMNQDGISARAVPDLSTNDTQVLVAVGFGFQVPPNAIIRGVTIELRVRQGFGPPNGTRDKLIGLVPFEGAANLAMDAPYSDVFTTRTYGGDMKRWGAKLTPKLVNAPEFGVVFQSFRTVYPLGTSVELDVLKMRIAYCE